MRALGKFKAVLLLGQSVPNEVYNVVQSLTPILSSLVTVIVLIALPIMVFHILTKEVLSKF
jgi:hypothetical protein